LQATVQARSDAGIKRVRDLRQGDQETMEGSEFEQLPLAHEGSHPLHETAACTGKNASIETESFSLHACNA
jgi:hypothetical protein